MNNTYSDLVDQTFNFPQEGYDLKDGYLQYNDVDVKALIDKYGTPLKFTYLPKIGMQINKAKKMFEHAFKNGVAVKHRHAVASRVVGGHAKRIAEDGRNVVVQSARRAEHDQVFVRFVQCVRRGGGGAGIHFQKIPLQHKSGNAVGREHEHQKQGGFRDKNDVRISAAHALKLKVNELTAVENTEKQQHRHRGHVRRVPHVRVAVVRERKRPGGVFVPEFDEQ